MAGLLELVPPPPPPYAVIDPKIDELPAFPEAQLDETPPAPTLIEIEEPLVRACEAMGTNSPAPPPPPMPPPPAPPPPTIKSWAAETPVGTVHE